MEYNEVDPELNLPSTSRGTAHTNTGSNSDERLIEIFEKEIDREIADRMGAISEISDNIKKCQQNLDRLRKEAVVKYYMGLQQDREKDERPSIHPAVKKLIGKRPRDVSETEEWMASNLAEWKRKTRNKLFKKCATKHKNKTQDGEEEAMKNEIIRPRYVPPNIPGNPQENSSLRGNIKKLHMRVLVGNVAKQIQVDGDIFDPATHKWMVYVRSSPGSLAADREVAKVHFFLHPSYKPHDVVTVPNPPFTLNRRGWGEFPMRVQLIFKNPLNKPVDIIHHLKLNGAISGHHTRSAETFADLWLYPYKSSRNKGKVNNSEDILSLASDMLKEEVPDFTTEVICGRCQTTSVGTDSHDCTCNIKDNTHDIGPLSNGPSEESSVSSAEESDSSDSDDSTVESMAPKPLRCWKIPKVTDNVSTSEMCLKEEIKDELLFDESFNKDSNSKEFGETINNRDKCGVEKSEPLKDENVFEKGSDVCSIKVKEEVIDSTSLNFFSLPNNKDGQFARVESDFLDVEASDIMDALEMKPEVKEEPHEIVEECINCTETKKSDVNLTTILGLKEKYLPNNKNQPSDVVLNEVENKTLDQLENQIVVENNTTVNSVQESLSSIINCHSENSFPDGNIIIEEVPIDDFINNIVEEEIVVEVPDIISRDESVKLSGVSNEHLKSEVISPVENPPLLVQPQSTCPNEVIQTKQTPVVNPVMEIPPSSEKSQAPLDNLVAMPKGLLLKNENLSDKQYLKTTDNKYIEVQPIKKTKTVTNMKELLSNNQTSFVVKGPLKGNLPVPMKEVTAKSPRYIQITKEHLLSSKLSPNANHVLKKLKINEPNQTSNTKEKTFLVSKGSLIFRPPIMVPKTEIINQNTSKNINTTAVLVDQNTVSKESTQKTSLLRPQFRNSSTTKLNVRNPNSLLRPILPKSNISTLNSYQPQLQNSMKQILPDTRPMTYSVLKYAVNNSHTQQQIKLQNSTVNSLNKNTSHSLISTQNVTVKQMVPVQKTVVSQTNNKLINMQSCNATIVTKNASKLTLGQEILRLSNNLNNKVTETQLIKRTEPCPTLPETVTKDQDCVSEKCNAPSSFNRQSYLPQTKSFISPNQGKSPAGKHKTSINLENSKDQTSSNDMCAVKDTISFYELLRVIHFPKSSIPSRPFVFNSGGREKEVVPVEVDCVLSCNSLHNDLQKPSFLQHDTHFARKAVMVSKDQLNAAVNEQVYYYLEQLRLLVNTCVFGGTEPAVRWLVRGLPLVHADARLLAFKMVHPYCAVSTQAYCSWPAFKQSAAEWLRAKTIVRILTALSTKGLLQEPVWSTKTVYWWCRTHGYSPAFCLIGPEDSTNRDKEFIQKLQEKTSPAKVLEWMASVRHKMKSPPEEEVDVVGDELPEGNEGKRSDCGYDRRIGSGSEGPICGKPWVRDMHSYLVNQVMPSTAGARLGEEPVAAGGPRQPVAATLLAHAAVGLAEDLLRRGLSYAARRGGGSVAPRDVCRAILTRPEFDMFTGHGLNVDTTFSEYLKTSGSQQPPS